MGDMLFADFASADSCQRSTDHHPPLHPFSPLLTLSPKRINDPTHQFLSTGHFSDTRSKQLPNSRILDLHHLDALASGIRPAESEGHKALITTMVSLLQIEWGQVRGEYAKRLARQGQGGLSSISQTWDARHQGQCHRKWKWINVMDCTFHLSRNCTGKGALAHSIQY